jgi:hypothetical protein
MCALVHSGLCALLNVSARYNKVCCISLTVEPKCFIELCDIKIWGHDQSHSMSKSVV